MERGKREREGERQRQRFAKQGNNGGQTMTSAVIEPPAMALSVGSCNECNCHRTLNRNDFASWVKPDDEWMTAGSMPAGLID